MSKLRAIQERNPNSNYDKPDLRGILDDHLKNWFPIPTLHLKNLTIKSGHLELIEHFNFSIDHTENKIVIVKPRDQHEKFKEYCLGLFLLGQSSCKNPETTFFLTLEIQLHNQIQTEQKLKESKLLFESEIEGWRSGNHNHISSQVQEILRHSEIPIHVSEKNNYTNDEMRNIPLDTGSASQVFQFRKAS